MSILTKTIQRVTSNFKLYTAAQFGMDHDVSLLLKDNFDLVTFFDRETDWSWKIYSEISDKNTAKYFSDTLLKDFEYLDRSYDLIYVHNRGTSSFKRNVLNSVARMNTKFILSHPSVIAPDFLNYSKVTLQTEEGNYALYYLDLVKLELDRMAENSK